MVNDLDIDVTESPQAAARYKNDPRNIRKIREATSKLEINIVHPLREGKGLLVLDLDYSKIVSIRWRIMANRNTLSQKRYWTLSPLLRALYLLPSAPGLVCTSFSKRYTHTMTYASGLSSFPMSDSSFIRFIGPKRPGYG